MADAYVGEIRMFAGNFAPRGWALCDGSVLPISQYSAVFSLIGFTYGGDNHSTFALPDLRGRVPVGVGQLAGGNAYTMGQKGGQETVTLLPSQIPAHSHAVNVNGAEATSPTPLNSYPGANSSMTFFTTTNPGTLSAMSSAAIAVGGGSQPHANMMPSVVVNFIICLLDGQYPPRP